MQRTKAKSSEESYSIAGVLGLELAMLHALAGSLLFRWQASLALGSKSRSAAVMQGCPDFFPHPWTLKHFTWKHASASRSQPSHDVALVSPVPAVLGSQPHSSLFFSTTYE